MHQISISNLRKKSRNQVREGIIESFEEKIKIALNYEKESFLKTRKFLSQKFQLLRKFCHSYYKNFNSKSKIKDFFLFLCFLFFFSRPPFFLIRKKLTNKRFWRKSKSINNSIKNLILNFLFIALIQIFLFFFFKKKKENLLCQQNTYESGRKLNLIISQRELKSELNSEQSKVWEYL